MSESLASGDDRARFGNSDRVTYTLANGRFPVRLGVTRPRSTTLPLPARSEPRRPGVSFSKPASDRSKNRHERVSCLSTAGDPLSGDRSDVKRERVLTSEAEGVCPQVRTRLLIERGADVARIVEPGGAIGEQQNLIPVEYVAHIELRGPLVPANFAAVR